ncbi:MAG: hypothetical protein AAFY90_11795, partial [Pseudomonadota bacterium]
ADRAGAVIGNRQPTTGPSALVDAYLEQEEAGDPAPRAKRMFNRRGAFSLYGHRLASLYRTLEPFKPWLTAGYRPPTLLLVENTLGHPIWQAHDDGNGR